MKSDWSNVPIKRLCLGIYDGPHATPPKSDSGAVFLGIPNFSNGRLDLSNVRYISEQDLPLWTKRVVPKAHDIVFSYEATLNLYAIIPEGFRGCLGRRMALMRPDESKVDYRFLFYYMFSPAWRTEIETHKVNGSTVDRIPLVSFPSFNVKLPDITTQRYIADILTALDDKIAINLKINHHLEQMAQVIFKSWFVDFEPFGGEQPDRWQTGSLTDIAEYLNGLAMQRFRPVEDEVGLPVLKIKELRQGSCDSQSELCSPNIRSDYIVHDGEVIFSWSGSLLVDFWCGGDCGLNQHLFKVTSRKYDKWFYYAWTCHHLTKFAAMAADKATTMGHIKREALEKAKVIIPDEDSYLQCGSLLNPLYEQVINNRVENRKLSQLRDTLLPRLMSGELSVPDIGTLID